MVDHKTANGISLHKQVEHCLLHVPGLSPYSLSVYSRVTLCSVHRCTVSTKHTLGNTTQDYNRLKACSDTAAQPGGEPHTGKLTYCCPVGGGLHTGCGDVLSAPFLLLLQ